MNRLLLFLTALTLLGHGASAQMTYGYTLSGIVRDSADGKPLNRAAIVIDYNKSVTGTYTDAEGRFAITVTSGPRILVVRHVGYVPIRMVMNVQRDTRLDMRLGTVSSQLEEVVVTSKGFDRTVRQPLLGVSQINIKTLQKLPSAMGEVDILRGLQMLPGVSSVGEAANGVNIRGGTTDQNLILLDDMPIFNPTHMFGLFSAFPPDAVSGLDLYKGNVPARYGGRAASVLDIALKNPSLDKFQLTGGISLVSNRLTAEIPIVKEKLSVLLSGRGAFNDFLLPLASPRLDNIKANFGDAAGKLFWRANDRNTFTLSGYLSKDFFQTSLLGSLANINATATQYDHQTLNGMARWFHVINPRLNVQTTAIIAHYVPKILSPELNSSNKVVLQQALLQRQFKTNFNYQWTNHKTEVGVNATHYRLNPGELLPGSSPSVNYQKTPDENAIELAIHADDEMSLTPELAVSAGLRYSYFMNLGPGLVRRYATGEAVDEVSVVDSVRYGAGQVTHSYGGFEPRLGIRYSVGPNASVKFGYNMMRQYLQVVTNTTTPLPTARWKTSDEHIRPQISQLLSVGWFQNLKENIYELTLEGYWRTTQNVIDYKPGADFLLQPYPETQLLQGRSKAYGVEMMLAKKKGELTGWVNYTFARTFNQVNQGASFRERINGGDWYRANYDRPHSFNASVNINQGTHHSFSFTFAYSSGRPYTAPEGYIGYQGRIYPYYNERNQERIPAYHRLDFSWNIYSPSMKARRWQGHWTFTVYNLYGRKNAYSVFFRTENRATKAYQLQIFAAPIPTLSYNFEFK